MEATASGSSSRVICWVVDGLTISEEGERTSALASNRYRAIIPGQALSDSGYTVRFTSFREWVEGTVDASVVHVIGKFLPAGTRDAVEQAYQLVLRRVEQLVHAGGVVLADFCDDHFQRASDGHYWRALAKLCSVCLAGSDEMAARVRQYASGGVVAVSDPIGAPGGEPKVFRRVNGVGRALQKLLPGGGKAQQAPLRLAWYGHPSNFKALTPWLDALAGAGLPVPVIVWVVTQSNAGVLDWIDRFKRRAGSSFRVEFVEWEEQTQWDVVNDAHIVLIPSDLGDVSKAVKSSNRLTDAMSMGCYVVASKVPSYLPYAEFVALVDQDPVAAVVAYLEKSPDDVLTGLRAGGALVRASCGPSAIARQWAAAIDAGVCRVASGRPPATGPLEVLPALHMPADAIRLNVGCGDKLLPGYINVDIVEARAGFRPDVISDIRDLSCFDTDYADEVLAVHVIEHFWRWEVEDVVREWVRVLKPGGTLVLECPNLQSACEAFLANPDAGASADQRGQRTMWVFYGDPQWKDPLMVHRWGYTPASLSAMLRGLGLQSVRQEPAQYKLREPRDMRIVAVKPLS